jgi:hypothetical protein
MLFTWDTTNLCIVFEGWRITGAGSLIVSLLAIVLMTAGYEAVREASRRYEAYASSVGERRGGDDLRGELLLSYTFGRRTKAHGVWWECCVAYAPDCVS